LVRSLLASTASPVVVVTLCFADVGFSMSSASAAVMTAVPFPVPNEIELIGVFLT
jgi:hypothetical protein